MTLAGRIALVTGAQQGIGRAAALALARAGADVGVNYLDDPEGASAVAREITAMGRAVPLGRMAKPAEIADVIVFLASDDARYVTGQTLFANGGVYTP